MEFEVLKKNLAKTLKGLITRKDREELGLFLAEGDKCVSDMTEAFPLRWLVATEAWISGHPEMAARYAQKILKSDKRGIEIISSMKSVPDVIGVFEKPVANGEIPSINEEKLYLLLDDIQDPGNLGTIIRTCDWFGVYDIFASPHTVDVFSPKVVQATMGSLSRVKVSYLDLSILIKKHAGMPVIGTTLDGKPYEECGDLKKGFLVMGNEGNGISENIKKLITHDITIPPKNLESHPDSLNVAIATAILLAKFT